jgi:carbon starvation protein CstA
MGIYNAGLATADTNPTTVVGIIATDYLGKYGGYIAIFAVVILAITSGDTALRSLRLTIGEAFGIDNRKVKNRLLICLVIFVVVIGLLLFEEMNNKGFDYLWRYFA